MGLVVRRPLGPPTPEDVDVIEGPAVPRIMLEGDLALTRLWLQADFDSAAARKESQVLGAKLDRLGNVNLDAVTELEEMESSYEFLVQQVKDLSESRQHLMETLRRMETESRALFEETFVAARENFAVIFRKLFQGGRADMFLAEGEDSLESGIEIVARPPGKELQSINLLSGGERSLTALAILFAVFKVKPSPFCILDEVDAALDEANVERFLRVLQEFVGPTQFCIVTHHKRTMAACQSLYGVTMQKRGVSSKLAVSLEQVDNFTNGNGNHGSNEALTSQRIAGEEQVGF
jgi:chromosome segregation protein